MSDVHSLGVGRTCLKLRILLILQHPQAKSKMLQMLFNNHFKVLHTKLHNISIYKYKMYNNSSNWPCHNLIITVLGKSEVYGAKLTSLFSWDLVCKNIKTVIYKIKMASECFTNQP